MAAEDSTSGPMSAYQPRSVFFDPWIDLDYYYSLLPLLPLIFERVYVYYPSDNWIRSTPLFAPASRTRYQRELIYWLNCGVLVPVVKGDYPLTQEIGGARAENDFPSDDFLEDLSAQRRSANDASWVALPAGSTARGRDSARSIIESSGGVSAVAEELRCEVNPEAVPELAYYYAGGQTAGTEATLVETIGTYENDDWMRREHELGEYLLPGRMAYQYRGLQHLLGRSSISDVHHNVAAAIALDTHARRRRKRVGTEWLERDRLHLWRELGLHHVLRDFLRSEDALAVGIHRPDEKAEVLAKSLRDLEDRLPAKIARVLLGENLLWEGLVALSTTLSGFVSSGPLGGVIGFGGGPVVGHVGKRLVRLGFTRIRWDRFLRAVERTIGYSSTSPLRRLALSFGDVTVFGSNG